MKRVILHLIPALLLTACWNGSIVVHSWCFNALGGLIPTEDEAKTCCAEGVPGAGTERTEAAIPPPAGCISSSEDAAGTTMLAGGGGMASIDQNLRSAVALAKGGKPVGDIDAVAQGTVQAATAGEASGLKKPRANSLKREKKTAGSLNALSGRGGGGSGTGSDSGLPSFSAIKNFFTGKDSAPQEQAATATDTTVAGTTYSGGGGTAGKDDGDESTAAGKALSDAFKAEDASGENGKTEEMGFGAEGAADSAMGSKDPEDYFSYMDIYANLFREVEKQYRRQTLEWKRQDILKSASNKSTQPKPSRP